MNVQAKILDRASQWFIKLEEHADDQHLRSEFEAWLAADLRHVAAYEKVRYAMSLMAAHHGHPAIEALHERAIKLGSKRETLRKRAGGWALAASLLLSIGIGGFCVSRQSREAVVPEILATRGDQRRTVELVDGSLISLDVDSEVAISMGDDRREVELLSGQARFKVAKDPSRPFIVMAGTRAVVAKGTDFVVNRLGTTLTVTLIHGRVAVHDRTGKHGMGGQTAELYPLDSIRGGITGGAWAYSKVDPTAAVAWQNGWLMFQNDRLDDAVELVNRYSRARIVLTAGGLASLHVSGAFRTGSSQTFANAVASLHGLTIRTSDDGTILLSKK
jgi:transmembrane sensor